jgi:hypothetical protein
MSLIGVLIMVNSGMSANEVVQIIFASITILVTLIGSVVASVKFIIRGQIDTLKVSMQENCGNINTRIKNIQEACQQNSSNISEIIDDIADISIQNFQFREKEGKLNHEREINFKESVNKLAFKIIQEYATKKEIEDFKKEIKEK